MDTSRKGCQLHCISKIDLFQNVAVEVAVVCSLSCFIIYRCLDPDHVAEAEDAREDGHAKGAVRRAAGVSDVGVEADVQAHVAAR